MSFYKQYPQPEMKLGEKLVIWEALYGSPLVYILLLLMMYFKNRENALRTSFTFGEINILYIQYMGGLLFIVYMVTLFAVVPILRKTFQKKAYLKKYGRKEDVKCNKIEKKGIITSNFFNFSIQGQKIVIKEQEGGKAETPLINKGVQEGDIVPLIYNPEDPTDCMIDSEKLLKKNQESREV